MMKYTYDYPRPALGTDILLFSKKESEIYLLLIQRKNPPFQDFWAFPGGFVEEGESCEDAAIRELQEETGLSDIYIKQVGAFSKPNRDPRGWVVSVAFFAWTDMDSTNAVAGDDAANVKWHPISNIPPLAFDHSEILKATLEQINK